MMTTACMEYSYNSDKAKEYLGYEPAYTLDEGIQKSLYEYWAIHFPDKVDKNSSNSFS
jgi:nucleoside-diphosphate-sugar epimerase